MDSSLHEAERAWRVTKLWSGWLRWATFAERQGFSAPMELVRAARRYATAKPRSDALAEIADETDALGIYVNPRHRPLATRAASILDVQVRRARRALASLNHDPSGLVNPPREVWAVIAVAQAVKREQEAQRNLRQKRTRPEQFCIAPGCPQRSTRGFGWGYLEGERAVCPLHRRALAGLAPFPGVNPFQSEETMLAARMQFLANRSAELADQTRERGWTKLTMQYAILTPFLIALADDAGRGRRLVDARAVRQIFDERIPGPSRETLCSWLCRLLPLQPRAIERMQQHLVTAREPVR